MKNLIIILLVLTVLTISCKKEETYSPTISVERIDCLKQKTAAPGDLNILLYQLKITSPITVVLSGVEVSVKSGASLNNNVILSIVIDDVLRGIKMYNKDFVSFHWDNTITLNPSQEYMVKIYADIDDAAGKGEGISLTLQKLQIDDILSGTTITSYNKPVGETLTIQ